MNLITAEFTILTLFVCKPYILHLITNTMLIFRINSFSNSSGCIASMIPHIYSFCSSFNTSSQSSYLPNFRILFVLSYCAYSLRFFWLTGDIYCSLARDIEVAVWSFCSGSQQLFSFDNSGHESDVCTLDI